MRKLTLLACCISIISFSCSSYKKLHQNAVVIDTHNDILTTAFEKNVSIEQSLKGKTHSDLNRLKQGGVDIQVFSVWCDGSYADGRAFDRANQQLDTLYRWIMRNPTRMMLVRNNSELDLALKNKMLGCMIGVEGGHMIEDDLDKLEELYNRGARYMTLTWNNSTSWASSALDETTKKDLPTKGLTDFGKQVVKKMNELGMLLDLSHVGEQTFWDAINTTTKPVVVSHSCVWSICPVFRNLKDEQIKAIGKNGGVIHLNFFSGFVDSLFFKRVNEFNAKHRAERDSVLKTVTDPYFADVYLFEKYPDEVRSLRPPLSALLNHLDYIVKLVGVDHVGLGSDFDGVNSTPQQLDDVTSFPLITKELRKRGYSKEDVKKILGENFIRLLKANNPR